LPPVLGLTADQKIGGMQLCCERAVDDRDPFIPGRLPTTDDSAVGFLENEVCGVLFGGGGSGLPGAVVDGGAGVGFHPGHGPDGRA